ncbi:hypothetical protein [Treponema sp. R80B11-R83G3]
MKKITIRQFMTILLGMITIFSLFFSIYSYYNDKTAKINIVKIGEINVLEINRNLDELQILYNDVDIKNSDKVNDPVGSTYDRANQKNGTVKSQLPKKNSLFNHYKKLIMLRNANPEIARGSITALDFSNYAVFGGFVSDYGGSKVGVFHNTGEDEVTVDLKNYTSENFTVVRGYVGKGNAALKGTVLTLDGFTSVVLK